MSLRRVSFWAALMLSIKAAWADVSIPAIFQQDMVLQRDVKIPLHGWADPGELVQASLGNTQIRTQADAQGNWRVEFPPMPASEKAMTLCVGGRNAIQATGIVVGDVWLAAGTGNMQVRIAEAPNHGQDIVAQAVQAKDALLRFDNLDSRPHIRPDAHGTGFWINPTHPWFPNVSATAYFFGEQLRPKVNIPVGIINASMGGRVEMFMSTEALAKIPGYEKELADIAARAAVFPKDPTQQKAAMDDFGKRLNDWDKNQRQPWVVAENDWAKARDAANAAKQPVPPEPKALTPPPKNPDGEPGDVTTAFNGLIAPLEGFPIKGIVWYAGESNENATQPQYEALQRELIADWREHLGNELPFIIVDLANVGPVKTAPVNNGAAEVRGAQDAVAASEPKTGLAETLDLGALSNTWLVNRPETGKRITATALHLAYGQNVSFEGPRFGSMTVEGGKIRVKYANPDVGLVLAVAPANASISDPNEKVPALPLDAPTGFDIAGADKKWLAARAQIDGNSVLVWSEAIPNPVAVRFGWAPNPSINLYSKDGFPAVPFRTQDWPVAP